MLGAYLAEEVKGDCLLTESARGALFLFFGIGKALSHVLLYGNFFLKGNDCFFSFDFKNFIYPLLRVNMHLVHKISCCYTPHRLCTQMSNQPIKKKKKSDFPIMVVSFNQNFITLMLY